MVLWRMLGFIVLFLKCRWCSLSERDFVLPLGGSSRCRMEKIEIQLS